MPTYDYECGKCGKRFEKFHKMSDKPVAVCPKCGGKAERLISAGSGVIFKGSGFYETDYKRKKDGKKSSSCSESPACKDCPASKEKSR